MANLYLFLSQLPSVIIIEKKVRVLISVDKKLD